MNLIDIRQVITQILGFLLMLAILRKFAWGPVLAMLDERRTKIADSFAEAERRQAAADATRTQLESELRNIEAQARQKLLDGVAEGQKVAAEIKSQAQAEAQQRLERAQDDIAREGEKAKELLKEQTISLALRTAEKILRKNLDDPTQRKLAADYIDELGAAR